MTIKSKVGLEAEFLLRDSKGSVIIPPAGWDRDGFPLLAEIRGEEAETAAEVVTNFMAKKLEIVGRMRKTQTMDFAALERIPLSLYKKANREINPDEKAGMVDKIRNIHDIDINEFSDQVIKKNKIQGLNVSCGLHVHFSCMEVDETEVKKAEYESVNIPISQVFAEDIPAADGRVMAELMRPHLNLYRYKGYEVEETLTAMASRLNKPAVLHIVDAMDKAFFDRFAPPEDRRTKYRQPGFYELKPYGFEYRSLPMTDEVEAHLFEIATTAFEILEDVNEF